jgi:hypothetical protein
MTLTHTDKPVITDSVADMLTHIRVNCADVASFKRFKLITGTRDLSVITSTVEYTGVGFSPGAIVFFCAEPTNDLISWGIYSVNSDTNNYYCVYRTNGGDYYSTALITRMYLSAGNLVNATVVSLTSDSFSLAWDKTGTITGTARFFALCLR